MSSRSCLDSIGRFFEPGIDSTIFINYNNTHFKYSDNMKTSIYTLLIVKDFMPATYQKPTKFLRIFVIIFGIIAFGIELSRLFQSPLSRHSFTGIEIWKIEKIPIG